MLSHLCGSFCLSKPIIVTKLTANLIIQNNIVSISNAGKTRHSNFLLTNLLVAALSKSSWGNLGEFIDQVIHYMSQSAYSLCLRWIC